MTFWLKMSRHNNVKIYNAFFRKNLCFICRHSSQRMMILLSRYYSSRHGTAITYAKKVGIFITIHICFHKEYLIKQEGSTIYILYVLSFFSYSDITLKLTIQYLWFLSLNYVLTNWKLSPIFLTRFCCQL